VAGGLLFHTFALFSTPSREHHKKVHQWAEKEERIGQHTAAKRVRSVYEQTGEDENRNSHANKHHNFVPSSALFVIVTTHFKLAPFCNRLLENF
jgi:hypothetical protein